MTLLPEKLSLFEYRDFRANSSLWREALEEICARHLIPPGALTTLAAGSNLVASVTGNSILKVFPPFLRFQWESERLSLKHLWGKLRIPTPKLLFQGEMDGWPYLIMTRLEGEPLNEIWPQTTEDQKISLLKQIGELISQVQQIETNELARLKPEWKSFVAQQRANSYARHEKKGLPEKFLGQIESYLEKTESLLPRDFKPVILTGEYTPENLLVHWVEGGWKLAGIFDFGDVMVGPAEYDLIGPATFLARGDSTRLRSLFLGFGISEAELNTSFRKKMMSLLLLHRYSDLSAQVCIENWQERASGIDDLQELVWGTN